MSTQRRLHRVRRGIRCPQVDRMVSCGNLDRSKTAWWLGHFGGVLASRSRLAAISRGRIVCRALLLSYGGPVVGSFSAEVSSMGARWQRR
jgi:hypothetical protein